MKIRFTGTWTNALQAGIPKGILALSMSTEDRKKVGPALKKLGEWQHKHGKLKDLEVNIEYYYKKRTLDQNALIWSLYSTLANEMNAGRVGESMVTAGELYDQDMLQHAKVARIVVPEEYAKWIKDEYRYIDDEKETEEGTVELLVRISTSHMNTAQCHQWIEMLFDRMAQLGVSVATSADLQKYWQEWRKDVGDHWQPTENKITGAEYKAAHTICEATGAYLIGVDSTGKDAHIGHLAHIKAKGMGGDPEGARDVEDNFLLLSAEAHQYQHQHGWEKFLKQYPWLEKKVSSALGAEPVGPEYRDDLY